MVLANRSFSRFAHMEINQVYSFHQGSYPLCNRSNKLYSLTTKITHENKFNMTFKLYIFSGRHTNNYVCTVFSTLALLQMRGNCTCQALASEVGEKIVYKACWFLWMQGFWLVETINYYHSLERTNEWRCLLMRLRHPLLYTGQGSGEHTLLTAWLLHKTTSLCLKKNTSEQPEKPEKSVSYFFVPLSKKQKKIYN